MFVCYFVCFLCMLHLIGNILLGCPNTIQDLNKTKNNTQGQHKAIAQGQLKKVLLQNITQNN